MPVAWRDTIFPQILCSMRCSPSCATKLVPAEVLLGRKLLYPLQIEKMILENKGNIS